MATAFTEAQLQRIHDETGVMSYTADIEVLDEALFSHHCPGKAEWVGYEEWKRRLVRAVDVFGPGRVNTGIVAGIELAPPYGSATRPGSVLGKQRNPASLDYYIRLAKGLHALRVEYRLPIMFDDYRHCGNHPDTDLSRLLNFD
jgi:hypothetical protein